VRAFFELHRRAILLSLAAGGLIIVVGLGALLLKSGSSGGQQKTGISTEGDGQALSHGLCQGTDKPKLGTSPMKPEDFSFVIPYGLMVDGHVTPIDHQYFAPIDYQSPLDAYEVYAMADSTITEIQPRNFSTGAKKVEYRFVFTLSCKLFYYYDLVTSLSPRIQAEFDKNGGRDLNISVKEGELIGRIGGQTLDFAVWDMDVVLPGLLDRENYDSLEPWKVHTADPLLYYTDELRSFILSRYVRTAEPISGKIDFDIDGKLIGNWFAVGTNGYAGPSGRGGENYWVGHLAIAPNHWDPTKFMVSFGDFGGKEAQFAIKGNSPDPSQIGLPSGLVKYDLVNFSYDKSDGTMWDGKTLIKGPLLREQSFILGCFLAELVENRQLKAESFPGQSCSSVSGFSSLAKTYER
jgi:hypothetical protein